MEIIKNLKNILSFDDTNNTSNGFSLFFIEIHRGANERNRKFECDSTACRKRINKREASSALLQKYSFLLDVMIRPPTFPPCSGLYVDYDTSLGVDTFREALKNKSRAERAKREKKAALFGGGL